MKPIHSLHFLVCAAAATFVSAASAQDRPTAARLTFSQSLPASLVALKPRGGGACFLDAINFAAIGEKPVVVKAGSEVSMGGWAVAEASPGKLGTSPMVQLRGRQTYYVRAEAYVRPGLGRALGNPSLDGGGLKIAGATLTVPADDYRVAFLVQSGAELLICDTGRQLRVE